MPKDEFVIKGSGATVNKVLKEKAHVETRFSCTVQFQSVRKCRDFQKETWIAVRLQANNGDYLRKAKQYITSLVEEENGKGEVVLTDLSDEDIRKIDSNVDDLENEAGVDSIIVEDLEHRVRILGNRKSLKTAEALIKKLINHDDENESSGSASAELHFREDPKFSLLAGPGGAVMNDLPPRQTGPHLRSDPLAAYAADNWDSRIPGFKPQQSEPPRAFPADTFDDELYRAIPEDCKPTDISFASPMAPHAHGVLQAKRGETPDLMDRRAGDLGAIAAMLKSRSKEKSRESGSGRESGYSSSAKHSGFERHKEEEVFEEDQVRANGGFGSSSVPDGVKANSGFGSSNEFYRGTSLEPSVKCDGSSSSEDVGHGGSRYVDPSVPGESFGESDVRSLVIEVRECRDRPDYEDKLKFAVKLGYTQEQLEAAWRSKGKDASNNDILEELNSLPSRADDPMSSIVSELFSGESVFDEEFASITPMQYVAPESGGSEAASSNKRPIVIDGSNVAMSHGGKRVFSCKGILLAVDYFRKRAHEEITVFIPRWRKEASRVDSPITDQDILTDLEQEKTLVFTPARRVGGKRIVCYDDKYILKHAADCNGVVVSNDHYRDLINESDAFRRVIEENILMYTFVNDKFMPPDDPLGRNGPSLDNFLLKRPRETPGPLPPRCPYGKKCTYGSKCRFYHPERSGQQQKSVSDLLRTLTCSRLQCST